MSAQSIGHGLDEAGAFSLPGPVRGAFHRFIDGDYVDPVDPVSGHTVGGSAGGDVYVATGFALRMIGGSETVLELVNKIGSAFYGPILATFWLGMLTRRGSEAGAILGLLTGVGFNIFLWQYYGSAVSWLWWNVFGFVISFALGYGISLMLK